MTIADMSTTTTADRGGRAGSSDPLGSIGWTEGTGGVLTARECVTLAGPLLRGELGILVGLVAMALRMHSGRRATIEPTRLAPRTRRWPETRRRPPRTSSHRCCATTPIVLTPGQPRSPREAG